MMTLKKFFQSAFFELELPLRASSLAYHSVLAIVPTLGMGLWYLSRIGVTEKLLNQTRLFVLSQLNMKAGSQFESHFLNLTSQVSSKSFGYLGGAILIFTGWSFLSKFSDSLDLIISRQRKFKTSVFTKNVLFIRRALVLLLLPLSVVFSLALSHWVQKDSWIKFLFKLKMVGPYLAAPLGWLSIIVTCFLVYLLVPTQKVSVAQALRAALFVGPLTELSRLLFGWINRYMVMHEKIYGVFSIVPLFMVWIYLFWILILSGGLLIKLPPPSK